MRPVLLQALRAVLNPAQGDSPALDSAARREAVATEAVRHGVAAVLARLPELAEVLRPAASAVHAAAMAHRALLRQVLALLGEARISPVVLKGYPLAARLYPDPLLRPSTDVDLLVARAELEAAERALTQSGFRSPNPLSRAYYVDHHQHVALGGPQGVVELHFSLGASGAALAHSPRTTETLLQGERFRLLAPEDELVFLAAHAARHHFERLIWLCDLSLFLGRYSELDWSLVASRARAMKVTGEVFVALTLVRGALDAQVPECALRQLDASARHRMLAATAFSERSLVYGRRSKLGQLCLGSLMQTPARAAAAFFVHHAARALRRRVGRTLPGLAPPRWNV